MGLKDRRMNRSSVTRGGARYVDLEGLKRRAENMGKAGDWGLWALQANTRILELDPGNFGALYRRGRCYEEQDDFPAAKEDYSRALQIQPRKFVEEALGRLERGWNEAEEKRKRRGEKSQAKAKKRAEKVWAETERVREEAKKGAERAREEAKKLAEDLRGVWRP